MIQLLPRPALAVQRWLALLKPGGTLGFSWGLAQDPRWVPVMAALDAHVPPGMSRFEAFFRRPPFDGTEPVERMLTEAGYQAVQTVTHQVDTVYDSAGQWWAGVPVAGPVGDRLAAHPARPAGGRPPGRLHRPGRPRRPRRHADPDPHLRLHHRPEIREFSPAEGDAVSKSALPVRSALEMLRLECPEYRISQRVIGDRLFYIADAAGPGVQPRFAQAETVDRLRSKLRIPEAEFSAGVPSIARVYDVLLGGCFL